MALAMHAAPTEFILHREYKCFQKLMYVRRLSKFSTYTLIQFATTYWYRIYSRILDRLPDINFLDHAPNIIWIYWRRRFLLKRPSFGRLAEAVIELLIRSSSWGTKLVRLRFINIFILGINLPWSEN